MLLFCLLQRGAKYSKWAGILTWGGRHACQFSYSEDVQVRTVADCASRVILVVVGECNVELFVRGNGLGRENHAGQAEGKGLEHLRGAWCFVKFQRDLLLNQRRVGIGRVCVDETGVVKAGKCTLCLEVLEGFICVLWLPPHHTTASIGNCAMFMNELRNEACTCFVHESYRHLLSEKSSGYGPVFVFGSK